MNEHTDTETTGVERWLPVVGWEDAYEVSSHGRVRSVTRTIIRKNGSPFRVRSKILKHLVGNHGYPVLTLSRFRVYTKICVHRLVARAFVPNRRPKVRTYVDHINRIRTDNRPENLRWCQQGLNCLNRDQSPRGKTKSIGIREYEDGRARKFVLQFCDRYIGSFRTEAEAVARRKRLYDLTLKKHIA